MSPETTKQLERSEAQDRDAIEAAEQAVLSVAGRVHSLTALRDELRKAIEAGEFDDIDTDLLRVAIFGLLNSGRIKLTSGRELEVVRGS